MFTPKVVDSAVTNPTPLQTAVAWMLILNFIVIKNRIPINTDTLTSTVTNTSPIPSFELKR